MVANMKAFAIGTDGTMKRDAVTYDVINDEGKVVKANQRVNRVVTDKKILEAIAILEEYSMSIIKLDE